MPRLSKIQKAELSLLEAEAAQKWCQVANCSSDTFKRIADILVKDGMWLGLTVDIWVVTGVVPQDNKFLVEQRKALIVIIKTLTKEFLFEGGGDVGDLAGTGLLGALPWLLQDELSGSFGIPNPLAFVTGMLKPLLIGLEKVEGTDPHPLPPHAPTKLQFAALPFFQRVFLTVMLPGVFRTAIEVVTSQAKLL